MSVKEELENFFEEDEEEDIDPEEAEFIKRTFETLQDIMKRLDNIEELLGIKKEE